MEWSVSHLTNPSPRQARWLQFIDKNVTEAAESAGSSASTTVTTDADHHQRSMQEEGRIDTLESHVNDLTDRLANLELFNQQLVEHLMHMLPPTVSKG